MHTIAAEQAEKLKMKRKIKLHNENNLKVSYFLMCRNYWKTLSPQVCVAVLLRREGKLGHISL